MSVSRCSSRSLSRIIPHIWWVKCNWHNCLIFTQMQIILAFNNEIAKYLGKYIYVDAMTMPTLCWIENPNFVAPLNAHLTGSVDDFEPDDDAVLSSQRRKFKMFHLAHVLRTFCQLGKHINIRFRRKFSFQNRLLTSATHNNFCDAHRTHIWEWHSPPYDNTSEHIPCSRDIYYNILKLVTSLRRRLLLLHIRISHPSRDSFSTEIYGMTCWFDVFGIVVYRFWIIYIFQINSHFGCDVAWNSRMCVC